MSPALMPYCVMLYSTLPLPTQISLKKTYFLLVGVDQVFITPAAHSAEWSGWGLLVLLAPFPALSEQLATWTLCAAPSEDLLPWSNLRLSGDRQELCPRAVVTPCKHLWSIGDRHRVAETVKKIIMVL